MRRFIMLILLLLSMPAFSDNAAPASTTPLPTEPWYQVEIIVFSHLTTDGMDSEQWPQITPWRFDTPNVVQLKPVDPQFSMRNPVPYQLLPSRYFILKREAAKLKSRREYKVLLHQAWIQPMTSAHYTLPVHIFGGEGLQEDGSTDYAAQLTQYNSAAAWQVDGTLKIDLTRYLNTHFNLLIAEPRQVVSRYDRNNTLANIHSDLILFHLQQSRRMRSKELNYIGHPLFGILIKMKKVEHNNATATQ